MFLWFITRIPIRYATHNIIKTPGTRLGTSVLRFSVCPKSVALSRREVMDKKDLSYCRWREFSRIVGDGIDAKVRKVERRGNTFSVFFAFLSADSSQGVRQFQEHHTLCCGEVVQAAYCIRNDFLRP